MELINLSERQINRSMEANLFIQQLVKDQILEICFSLRENRFPRAYTAEEILQGKGRRRLGRLGEVLGLLLGAIGQHVVEPVPRLRYLARRRLGRRCSGRAARRVQ